MKLCLQEKKGNSRKFDRLRVPTYIFYTVMMTVVIFVLQRKKQNKKNKRTDKTKNLGLPGYIRVPIDIHFIVRGTVYGVHCFDSSLHTSRAYQRRHKTKWTH